MQPVMISLSEAARELRLSRQRVQRMVSERGLPSRSRGNQVEIDRKMIGELRRRPAGRPLSSRNAWALLAILSGARPDFVDRFQLSRLRRLAADRKRTITLLRGSQARSHVHRLEFFPAQLPALSALLSRRTGLAAQVSDLHLVAGEEGIDAYVSVGELEEIKRRFGPEEGALEANALLRVPTEDWVLRDGVTPIVVAADLLNDGDPRVIRAAEAMF